MYVKQYLIFDGDNIYKNRFIIGLFICYIEILDSLI